MSKLSVGMSDIVVVQGTGVLSAFGLGSCIGLGAFCRRTKVGGMVHIMLPEAFVNREVEKPGKFADTAVPALLESMNRAGASSQLVWFYAGGAQVFQFGGASEKLDIGARNAEAVDKIMNARRANVLAREVGGNQGRTLTFDVATGLVLVRTVAGGERTLCGVLDGLKAAA